MVFWMFCLQAKALPFSPIVPIIAATDQTNNQEKNALQFEPTSDDETELQVKLTDGLVIFPVNQFFAQFYQALFVKKNFPLLLFHLQVQKQPPKRIGLSYLQ